MGIFDNLSTNNISQLTPHSAMLLSAITIMSVDGEFDDDELSIMRRLRRCGNESDHSDAVRAWKKTPTFEECIDIVNNSLNTDEKQTVMANLVDIAMADGVLDRNEEKLLMQYVDKFNLPHSLIEDIVNVIAIKNKQI